MTFSILPNGRTQYLDGNGNPLASGSVTFYIVNTTTYKTTWQDYLGTTPNTNPVILDGNGEATIWGSGVYQQLVKDVNGNTIWNQVTSDGGIGALASVVDPTSSTSVYAPVVASIAALRALPKTGAPNCFVTNYYNGVQGGGGPYSLISSSSSGYTDNGGSVIIASDGGVWELQTNGQVSVQQFGAYVDNSHDDTTAINAAVGAGFGRVYQPVGTSLISNVIIVGAGTTYYGAGRASVIQAKNNMPAYAPWGSAHQGQCVLLNGNGASIEDINIFGNNFNAGGVGTWNFDQNHVLRLTATNCGTSYGILSTVSTNTVIDAPYVEYAGGGLEIFQCIGTKIINPQVDVVAGGGIFTADCTNFSCIGGSITNCGDVGIDHEGGVNVNFTGVQVAACNNGEASYFANSTGSGRVPANVTFIGCTLTRSATYQSGTSRTATATNANAGAIMVYSSTPGQQAVSFNSCVVYATGRPCVWIDDLGINNCGITLKNIECHGNYQLHNINRAYNLKMQDVLFHGYGAANTYQNEYKNCDSGLMEDITYDFDNAVTNVYALHYYTDAAIVTGPSLVNLKFRNCGTHAFLHDPFTSGVSAFVEDCTFTDSPQTNGGIEATANGYPKYRNQPMTYLINGNLSGSGPYTVSQNLNALTSLQSSFVYGTGQLAIVDGAFIGNTYSVRYNSGAPGVYSLDGSGSGTGTTASSSRFATFSGSTITITGPDNQVYGHYAVTLNTAL